MKMAQMGKHKERGVPDRAARLRIADNAVPGWHHLRPGRQPFFRAALLIMFAYGVCLGILYCLYKSGSISFKIKELYLIPLHLLILGSLYVCGRLTPGRSLLLFVNTAIFVAWNYATYGTHRINTLSLFVECWIMGWWLIQDPDTMRKLGLRRREMAGDVIVAVALGVLVMGYALLVFTVFGFTIQFDAWKVTAHASNMLGQNLIIFSLMFAVWKRFQDMGISDMGAIAVLTAVASVLQFPVFAGYFIGGGVSGPMIAAGFVFGVAINILVAALTFRRFQNIFPVALIVTAFQECMYMAGLL